MSTDALYERYKDALRTGHIAAVRGRLEAAVEAYAEAAALAPDRPLPHASLGRVLLRLQRVDEALDAFGVALRCAPRDEVALTGRADALVVAGRPVEAAGVLDLLADTQEGAGRLPDACDTVRRALELVESRARRRHLEALVGELRGPGGERADEPRIAQALRALAAPRSRTEEAPAISTSPEHASVRSPDVTVHEGEAAAVEEALVSEEPAVAEEPTVAGASPATIEPAVAQEPLFVADTVTTAVDAAIQTADPAVVHEVVLASVSTLRRAGLLTAALDACTLGLTVAPSDPDLHLVLAELELDHGWIQVAADKLAILYRFVELTGDSPARERVCAMIGERFPDDARLRALCA
jgi:tetratricopeptide (TPR) repeat protein